MGIWLLVAIALGLLLLMTMRERYVDTPGPGPRPTMNDAGWRSKIDAQAPIGASDEDYINALQKFYDTIYAPLRTQNATASPKDTEVETFLTNNTFPNVSKDALRQIILSGFSIDRTESAAAREEKQVKFTPTEALQPRDAVDEVYGRRRQEIYEPAVPQFSNLFSEGNYGATEQTYPTREDTGRTPFESVCPCAQNVL